MTTLIPKFDFKNGGATPTGAINRPINEKLGDWVSVKDFGAVGDGVADDTVAIQAAIDYIPNGLVIFPAGTYKISAAIKLKGSILGTGLATVIQPTADTFAAFTNNNVGLQKFSIKGLFINYGVATGNVQSTNPLSAGFNITGSVAGEWPFEFSIDEVWIRYAYYGYKDSSSSYMFTLSNIRVDYAQVGFSLDTNGKTTVNVTNCFVVIAKQAFYFFGISGLIFDTGGFDLCDNTVGGGNLFYCATCQSVNLFSVNHEANTIGYEFTSAFAFDACGGVNINGLRGFQNTFATGSTEVRGISFADGSFGSISGVTLAGSGEVSTGTGAMYAVLLNDSKVTIDACNLTAPAGTSGTKLALAGTNTSTAVVTKNNNAFVASPLDATSTIINNQIPLVSTDNGNADVNVISGISSPTQLFNTPLSTTRVVYIGTLGLFNGAQFTVVRTSAASGGSGLQIYDQTALALLKTLSAGEFATVTYTGSAWIVTASGSL